MLLQTLASSVSYPSTFPVEMVVTGPAQAAATAAAATITLSKLRMSGTVLAKLEHWYSL